MFLQIEAFHFGSKVIAVAVILDFKKTKNVNENCLVRYHLQHANEGNKQTECDNFKLDTLFLKYSKQVINSKDEFSEELLLIFLFIILFYASTKLLRDG